MRRSRCDVFFHHPEEVRSAVLPTTLLQRLRHLAPRVPLGEPELPAKPHPPAQRLIITRECGSRVLLWCGRRKRVGRGRLPLSVPSVFSGYVENTKAERAMADSLGRLQRCEFSGAFYSALRCSVKGVQNFRIFRPLAALSGLEWKAVGP